MAVKTMTPVKGNLNEITSFAFEAATSTTDGFVFTKPRVTDESIVVVAHNGHSAAAKLIVKAPTNGSYYAAGGDEELSLAAGAYAIFRFESAKWANNDGTITIIPENLALKAAVLY